MKTTSQTIFRIIGGMIGYYIVRNYPGILLHWLTLLISYVLGSWIFQHIWKHDTSKDGLRIKISLLLTCLGLLGLLIMPLIGFIFALLGVLIADTLISKENKGRKQVQIFGWIVLIVSILYANLVVVLYH